MKFIKPLFIFFISLALTSCISYDFSRKIVKQGNLLPPAKIQSLKIGMSKEEVGKIMGTSLISPMFNLDRWDYANTWRCGTDKIVIKNLTLYFKNNQLNKIVCTR